jgi:hypothetical protein
MTPKQAYDNVASRARWLLRFYDALANTRQRGMRADWKGSFCRLMHWPQASQIDRVDTKDAVIILRHGTQLTSADFVRSSVDDLLRMALVTAVSALDRYLHERVVKRIIEALKQSTLRPAQEKLTISATLALRLTEHFRRAAKAGQNVRPANQLRIALQEALHRQTFQSWHELESAFELIGISGVARTLQQSYRINDMRIVRNQLNAIAQRRNQVVHEGDLIRHQRGGKCRLHDVSRRFVEESLDFLDDLVGRLELVT